MACSLKFTGRNICWKLVTEPGDARLCMPSVFVRLCSYTVPKSVFLITGDGDKHPVNIMTEKCTAYLTSGWRGFRDFYQIGMFDMLLFSWNETSHIHIAIFKRNGGYNPLNRFSLALPETSLVGRFFLLTSKNTCWKLITSPGDSRLCMPDVFVPQCEFRVPQSTLLVGGDGRPHKIDIKKEKGMAYLTDGWSVFSTLHDIGMFSMLLFSWEHPSKIDVFIFESNGGDSALNNEDYDYESYLSIPGHPSLRLDWERCASAPAKLLFPNSSDQDQKFRKYKKPRHDESASNNNTGFNTSNGAEGSENSSFEIGPDSPEPCLTPVPTNGLVAGEYQVTLDRKSTSIPYHMELPMRFARGMLKPGKNDITLDRFFYGFWHITCELGEDKCIVSRGWETFVKQNQLSRKDTIVFSREGTRANLWKVLVLDNGHKKK